MTCPVLRSAGTQEEEHLQERLGPKQLQST